ARREETARLSNQASRGHRAASPHHSNPDRRRLTKNSPGNSTRPSNRQGNRGRGNRRVGTPRLVSRPTHTPAGAHAAHRENSNGSPNWEQYLGVRIMSEHIPIASPWDGTRFAREKNTGVILGLGLDQVIVVGLGIGLVVISMAFGVFPHNLVFAVVAAIVTA